MPEGPQRAKNKESEWVSRWQGERKETPFYELARFWSSAHMCIMKYFNNLLPFLKQRFIRDSY